MAGVALTALGWLWWRAWFPVDAVVAAAVCVACRRGGHGTRRHRLYFAWQAWRLATCVAGMALTGLGWLWWRAWFPVDAVVAAAVVAGVALGDIDLHLAWQAWHLVTWTCTLSGRRGTYGAGWLWWRAWFPQLTPLSPRLFAWQAWHLATSTSTWLGTWRHGHAGFGYIRTKQNKTLHYIALHYITLHYIKLHYITLHYITYIHTIFVTHHLSLSHNIFQIQLCPTQLFSLLDPSPPPLSFLPSPFRCNICCSLSEEVDMWGVIRSFNRF